MYFYQNSLVKDCHVYIFFANKSRCTCLFLICIKQLDRLDIKSISLSECISVLKALKSKPDVQACISIFYFSVRYCPEQMVHVVYCIMFEFFCFRWHDLIVSFQEELTYCFLLFQNRRYHWCVLSANPFFAKLYESKLKEQQTG